MKKIILYTKQEYMYIEIKELFEICNDEENEYHQRNIKYFKSNLIDAMDKVDNRVANKTITFSYNKNTQKFKLLDIPNDIKRVFLRAKEVDYKLKKWF